MLKTDKSSSPGERVSERARERERERERTILNCSFKRNPNFSRIEGESREIVCNTWQCNLLFKVISEDQTLIRVQARSRAEDTGR